MTSTSKKTCFVIAPIGNAGSETRKHSDQLLNHIIKPTVRSCGYEDAERADKIAEPGTITSQVIEHILQDDLVIADLSEENANVFYELAIRHAIKKPLIHMIAEDQQIPFDVRLMRAIHFNLHDLDNVEQTKEELKKQILYLDEHPDKAESPLSSILNIRALKGSKNPEDQQLGIILAEIAEMKSVLFDLKFRASPTSSFVAGSGAQTRVSVLSPDLSGVGYHTLSEHPPPAPSPGDLPPKAPSGKADAPRKPAK